MRSPSAAYVSAVGAVAVAVTTSESWWTVVPWRRIEVIDRGRPHRAVHRVTLRHRYAVARRRPHPALTIGSLVGISAAAGRSACWTDVLGEPGVLIGPSARYASTSERARVVETQAGAPKRLSAINPS